jgi:phosphohistidine phosphatase SixA
MGFRLLVAALLAGVCTLAGADDSAAWAALRRDGAVALVRHGEAPGVGDPAGWKLDDCATQRNLDDHGREEARRIGAAFRTQGIPVDKVLSSRWCRCVDTARLAFGRVELWEPIDGARPSSDLETRRTAEVRRFVSTPFSGGNVILVTHNFNIRALTGLSTLSGEIVVLTPRGNDRFEVAGRLAPRGNAP